MFNFSECSVWNLQEKSYKINPLPNAPYTVGVPFQFLHRRKCDLSATWNFMFQIYSQKMEAQFK